ncbi:succinylglutamate desuccinylase [Izhakiella australiensis]|uniref:Succinylglutamate desuccinylase n=1 Tax=Izhakiella australiensis TaxID=1926881 RepID=A0A1S8YKZ1_9GAMM|nr:succinylglutamate desuccinylase/aspartoacylase family protein [Izhakiella australiensis]OON39710.1 succinylglutamate desuccinylase [Izhakiella australiensis]
MQQQHHPLLSAALGTQREIISYHFGPQSDRQVYIQASLHGDELPGMVVAWYLKQHLARLEAAGKLNARFTLVPLANPIALSQHWQGSHLGRFHSESGQDFNRQFPALGAALAARLTHKLTLDEQQNRRLIRAAIDEHFSNIHPASELDSQRFILLRMAAQADLMLDLHCDWEAVPHLYTMPHAWPEIEPLARLLGSEVQLLAQISGGEPFDEACCEPWITLAERFGDNYPMPRGLLPATLELRGVRDVSAEQAERDAEAIIAALTHGSYIQGDVGALPALKNPASSLAGCEYLFAPHSGVILHRRQPGEWIKAGETVAEILDPLSDRLTPIVAQHGGLLYARHWMRFATRGMLVSRLAGEDAGRRGQLLVP